MDQKVMAILGLTGPERRVLGAVRLTTLTPTEVAQKTRVSRTAVYNILYRLKKRGLVTVERKRNKRYWKLEDERSIKQGLHATEAVLFPTLEGAKEIGDTSGPSIVLHRGKKAIHTLLKEILFTHKNTRWRGLQGDTAHSGWEKLFTVSEIDELNHAIKKNKITVESVYPRGWFEKHTKALGKAWAKEFEGRSLQAHLIDPQYFDHTAQMWMFEDSLYLIAMQDELIIEIKHKDIQLMIVRMLEHIEHHSDTIDANALLRRLAQ